MVCARKYSRVGIPVTEFISSVPDVSFAGTVSTPAREVSCGEFAFYHVNPRLTQIRDSLLLIVITRSMLSLKKTANSSGPLWSFSTARPETIKFPSHTTGSTDRWGESTNLGDFLSKIGSMLPEA